MSWHKALMSTLASFPGLLLRTAVLSSPEVPLWVIPLSALSLTGVPLSCRLGQPQVGSQGMWGRLWKHGQRDGGGQGPEVGPHSRSSWGPPLWSNLPTYIVVRKLLSVFLGATLHGVRTSLGPGSSLQPLHWKRSTNHRPPGVPRELLSEWSQMQSQVPETKGTLHQVKQTSHKRTNIVRGHLPEAPGTFTFRETETRGRWVPEDGAGGELRDNHLMGWEILFRMIKNSVGG